MAVFRERARVDRGLSCFSMVLFLPAAGDWRGLWTLARILKQRARAYDIVGRLDSHRLAVLLPDTDGEGAWSFADTIVQRLSREHLKFDCEVYTYPLPPGPDEFEDQTFFGRDPDRRSFPPRTGTRPGSGPGAPGSNGGGGAHDGVPGGSARRGRSEDQRRADEPEGDGLSALATVRRSAGLRPVRDLGEVFVLRLPLWKRALDILVASFLLLLLSPVLLLVAIAIKLTSPGPIIFSQPRAGLGGRPFSFYKFRSMALDAEEHKSDLRKHNEVDGPIFKIKKDPRITPLGSFLRKTSIDELPQLWNVLRGDMTLVGPRPPTLDEIVAYERWHFRRLSLTGGLTCIWQVSGRSEVGFEDWVRMDIRYAQRRSLWTDLLLLLKTPWAVISGRGAY